MKKAVIITENKYPQGDAGALRQHAFAKMFSSLNYSVDIIGYGESTDREFKVFDGINYISLRSKSNNRVIRLCNRVLFGLRAIACLKHMEDVEVILVVDTLPYAFKLIKKFADKRGIMLIHDSVEWYSPEEYLNGEKNIQYRLKERTNISIIHEGWRVVAISKYLYEHFYPTVDKVVRIPVIMDIKNMPYSIDTYNKKIKVIYAGFPGLKDCLKELILGLSLLPEEKRKLIEVCIIGISQQQLCSLCGIEVELISKLRDSVCVVDRIPREKVIYEIMSADYTFLLRNAELRYAKAGFPTKIVESLACGTPPMCNISSDLADYLHDGENAIIINGQSADSVRDALLKAISYKNEGRNLRLKARETADIYFDYRHYIDVMEQLMSI